MSDRNQVMASGSNDSGRQRSSMQEKVEEFFNRIFGKWGLLLAAYPGRIFSASVLFFILLSMGMAMRATYADENLIWTPEGNLSLKSQTKGSKLFPAKSGFVSMIAEIKDPSKDGTLITVGALNEIKDYVDKMEKVSVDINGTKVAWTDICNKGRGATCFGLPSILSFGQVNNQWKPPATDQDFLSLVQTGKLGQIVIELDGKIGGTTPEKVNQKADGTNDLKSAKAAMLGYSYSFGDYTRDERGLIEKALEEEAEKFNQESKEVNIYLFTPYGLQQSFAGDMMNDLGLVQVSVTLVAVYCIIFMGGCSPIHFRSGAAGIALLCVGLSFASSSGVCYMLGGKSAGIHQLLPFLLIGIGVDDCFVIASNIDQADPRLPIEKRMMIGLQHAGSSITITSFTNAIAFFLGCTASLEALSSFCFFAGMGIIMLYLTSISVFSAFMVWDIKRQASRKGDCCGGCMCKEDTIICCRGFCLTTAQKSYPFQGNEEDALPDEKYANGTQKFLHLYFSKATTSKAGIITILSIWLIYLGVSLYGVSQVKIDFKQSYFIGAESYVKNFFDKQDEFFKTGDMVNIYTDASNIDITSYEMQANLESFNDKVKKCDGCSKQFTISSSFTSWYDGLKIYSQAAQGACAGSWDSSKKAVKPASFMACLKAYLGSQQGSQQARNVNMNDDKTKVTSFRQNIKLIFIEDSASEGVELLDDMSKLCSSSNLGDTFTFAQNYLSYETYVVFQGEAIMNVVLALCAVFVVIMIVTANIQVTLFILLCVALVDVFLLGLLYFWDVTFNSVTVVNNVIAIGLAVDYSAHIGHAYLMAQAPDVDEQGNKLSNHEKRVFKARSALGSMGSSVFHGAFSTFLAIVVLAPSKSYIFMSFFKMWLGIIVYGVANGFILLPVLLACCGPLNAVKVSEVHPKDIELQDKRESIEVEAVGQSMEGGVRINQVSTERKLQQ